jgi:hypothetical protein
MRKSVKFLAVLLIFLMPLSAFAESWWSPNRVRVNLRVGGSNADGGIGGKSAKVKCSSNAVTQANCATYSLADSVVLTTMSLVEKEVDRTMGGLSIHYIMEMGMIVGVHRFTTEYVTAITQTSDWAGTTDGGAAATAVGAGTATTMNTNYGGAGTLLGARKVDGFINFLDLGYFYDMKDIMDGLSISGGIGLPLLGVGGSSTIYYGATGYALNGNVMTEDLSADSGSAMSFFVDYGYAFGIHEALFSIRNVKTESSATVSTTKGIGKVTGEDKFASSGSSMNFSLGYGYIF